MACTLHRIKCLSGDQIKTNEMGGACTGRKEGIDFGGDT